MKLSNAVLLSAVLMLGASFAAAQDRNDGSWNSRDGYWQTVQYNTRNGDNADYQRGFQDGINSGRADANEHKRFDIDSHPYYRNAKTEAYRDGFAKGYREAYGQDRSQNGRYNNNGYPNGQYNSGYPNGENGRGNTNNPEYQKGFQDGINSGRADANAGKRADVESHPYYRNSNNQVYREGFMQGYRDAYGQDRAHNGGNSDHNPYYNH